MPKGPETRILRKDQIDRLERFRRTPHDGSPAGYSYPQLRLALGSPCSWETVRKALQGRPIAYLIHARISEWIDRYLPPVTLPKEGKASALATDRPDEAVALETETEERPTTITFPGRARERKDDKGEN